MTIQTRLSRLRRAAGEGRIGAIIALVVVAVVIYWLVKYVPVRIHNAELAHFVEERTRAHVVRQIDEDQLRDSILAEASRLGIDLHEGQLNIQDTGRTVAVSINYDRVIPMIWGDWTSSFRIAKEVQKL